MKSKDYEIKEQPDYTLIYSKKDKRLVEKLMNALEDNLIQEQQEKTYEQN